MNEQELKTSNMVSRVLSFVTLAIDIFLLGLIVWQTTIIRDSFQKIFADFEVQLPVLTELLLSVPAKVYAVTAACLGILLIVKETTIANQSIKLGINILASVVLLVFAVLFHMSLLMPWMSLVQNLR